jgi:purine nucleoside phosphorylase
MGGDLFGTHTVPEVIAARHMDVSVMALSAVTRHLLPGPDDEAHAPTDALAAARPALHRLLEGVLGEGTPEEKSV